jgi:hypothetical protein
MDLDLEQIGGLFRWKACIVDPKLGEPGIVSYNVEWDRRLGYFPSLFKEGIVVCGDIAGRRSAAVKM